MTDSDPPNPFADLPRKPVDLSQLIATPEYLRLRPKYAGVEGKYQIGELGFSRKDDVEKYVAAIRRDFAWKRDIKEEPAHGDIRTLFARSEKYRGESPVGFRVVAHPNGAGWGAHLAFVRADGTEQVFGVGGCLGKINYLADAKAACRSAVEPDRAPMLDHCYDEHAGDDGCVECHSPGCARRVSRAEAEVDHAGPFTFAVIFDDWIAARRIVLETFTHNPSGGFGPEIRDPALRADWIEYHRSRPLRLLCKDCNFLASVLYRINKDDRRLVLPEGKR